MDAPLESINGSGDSISGIVKFDPENPELTKGEITLDAKSLHVGNPVLKEHMLGKDWLNAEKFPSIRFTLNQLNDIKIDGIHLLANAHGKNDHQEHYTGYENTRKVNLFEGYAGEA